MFNRVSKTGGWQLLYGIVDSSAALKPFRAAAINGAVKIATKQFKAGLSAEVWS